MKRNHGEKAATEAPLARAIPAAPRGRLFGQARNDHVTARQTAAKAMIAAAASFLLVLAHASAVSAGTVTINGYTFSTDVADPPFVEDSAMLGSSPFFADYPRLVDLVFTLYGYGSFAGKDNTFSYRQTFTVKGVQCAVVMEQGYIPVFDAHDGSTSFSFVFCTAYFYLARDIDDNIHILDMFISLDDAENTTLSWDVDDLPAGRTTLLYPSDPEEGQEVFCGTVVKVTSDNGSGRAMVILRDDFPFDYPGPLREYLVSGSGISAHACDWDGSVNGFSHDGRSPDAHDGEDAYWEEWVDDHCFITASRH